MKNPTTAHQLVAALTAVDNDLSPYDAIGEDEMSRTDLLACAGFTTGFLYEILRQTHGAELPAFLRGMGAETANGKLTEAG